MLHHPIQWLDKLRNGLLVMAFCMTIAAMHVAFKPEQRFHVSLAYSLCIGMLSWALIDFGAHFFPSAKERGWPTGAAALALPVMGNLIGFLVGTWVVDAFFGFSSWSATEEGHLKHSILITALAGGVACFYFYSKYRHLHLQTDVAQSQAQAAHAQLKLLQAQLDPHLLFNTLANLRALITFDPSVALAMLDRMDAYFRATLSASRTTEHPLADEFARLEDYLALMQLRMGDRLRYTLDLPADLAHISVPSLILQPLVENSIKHGLEPKVAGGEVCVRAQWRQGHLHLSVADTGVGMNRDMGVGTPHPNGFGMAQLRERLQTRFGDNVTIEYIANKPEGTCVNMVFSLQK